MVYNNVCEVREPIELNPSPSILLDSLKEYHRVNNTLPEKSKTKEYSIEDSDVGLFFSCTLSRWCLRWSISHCCRTWITTNHRYLPQNHARISVSRIVRSSSSHQLHLDQNSPWSSWKRKVMPDSLLKWVVHRWSIHLRERLSIILSPMVSRIFARDFPDDYF